MNLHGLSLSAWDEIKTLARHGWIYRGQPRSGMPHETSLERSLRRNAVSPERSAGVEKELLREFRRAGDAYLAAEAVLGEESGFNKAHRVVFGNLRIADYRASIYDIAEHLRTLMTDAELRARMGAKGRERVVSLYDYRVVARQFVDYVRDKLGIQ